VSLTGSVGSAVVAGRFVGGKGIGRGEGGGVLGEDDERW